MPQPISSDPPRLQGEDPLDGALDPLPHLHGGDRLARVAAVPALDVEGGVGGLVADVALVVERLPLGHLLVAVRGDRRRLGAVDHLGHEPASCAGTLRSATTASLTCGMAQQGALDLARLDPEAADLDLLVDPAAGTPARRPGGSGRGRRCGRAARPARRSTDRARSARPSAPAGSGSRAPRRRRRCRSSPQAPDGDEPETAVHPVDPRALSGAADRDRRPLVPSLEGGEGRGDRGFGGTIGVQQLHLPALPADSAEPGGQPMGLRLLAADHHQADPGRSRRPLSPRAAASSCQ